MNIEKIIDIDGSLYERLKAVGISQTQINKYRSCILTEEKLRYLIEIKEHHAIVEFIDFTSFEAMNVEQLSKSLNWIQEYADGWIQREGLVNKIENILTEQEKIITNMSQVDLLLKDYLTPEVFQYVDKLHIGFDDKYNNAITAQRVDVLSIEGIQNELENIIRKKDPMFFSDKEYVLFEISFFNDEYCSLYLNTRTQDILVQYTPDQLNQLAKKEPDKEIRSLYEKFLDIRDLKNFTSLKRKVIELKNILNELHSPAAEKINDDIIDTYVLYNLTISRAKKGPNVVKTFLKDYSPMEIDEYCYLNAEGNIEMIYYDRLDSLLCEVAELDEFKGLDSMEHSRKHICRLSKRENASLINACLENAWLSDEDFDLSDYHFDFIKCHRKLDLMNYMSQGNWALRQGFVYNDIAFVQQVNGGDEYLTLIKKNDEKWIAFDSVSVEKSIEMNEFYSYFGKICDRGFQIRYEKSKKARVDEPRTL